MTRSLLTQVQVSRDQNKAFKNLLSLVAIVSVSVCVFSTESTTITLTTYAITKITTLNIWQCRLVESNRPIKAKSANKLGGVP